MIQIYYFFQTNPNPLTHEFDLQQGEIDFSIQFSTVHTKAKNLCLLLDGSNWGSVPGGMHSCTRAWGWGGGAGPCAPPCGYALLSLPLAMEGTTNGRYILDENWLLGRFLNKSIRRKYIHILGP
jgi:hypothetical protein